MKKKLAFLITLTLTVNVLATQNKAHANNNLNTQASAMILIDADTGIILEEHNPHEHRYPASLTKLMTALLLIEHVPLEEEIRMSHNAMFSIPRTSSHIAMNVGETITALEALYAIMLASANDVSNAIAEHIIGYGGDFFHAEQAFAALMTARARQLGAMNTNFKNAHGLHNPLQVTTAYDVSLIMRELIQHPIFNEVIGTRFTKVSPTEFQPLERPLNNTNRMIQPGYFFNPYVVGGKTGFTNEAAHTLATYARNGAGLIAVVLETPRFGTFTETENLISRGFNNYRNIELLTTDFSEIVSINGENVLVRPEANLIRHLPNNINPENINTQIIVPGGGRSRPVINVNYGDINLGQMPLVIEEVLFTQPASRNTIVTNTANETNYNSDNNTEESGGYTANQNLSTQEATMQAGMLAPIQNTDETFLQSLIESLTLGMILRALLYSAITTFAIFRINRMLKLRRARKRRRLQAIERRKMQAQVRGSNARRQAMQRQQQRNTQYNYTYKRKI
ncbi:MAG: D-alanyl-D-alanine carboxypeptidase [Defluviitaleaceae bacterium]|nr:D-alanyl-D-alanine carboxypeptidase [Defluviitaleaceae bacterium]